MGKYLDIFKKYHIDKDYENLGLFQRLKREYSINKVLYPGSYVHITPIFVFPKVIFNDIYKKLILFYESKEILDYIKKRKEYPEEPKFSYIQQDYSKGLPVEPESFDLLISQYAGFVSRHCYLYLKIGGILVANNSHGDAGMAHLMDEFEFIAVMNRSGNKFSHSTKNLDCYFIPKKSQDITFDYLEKLGRGIGYTKYATDYVFQRVK